MKKIAIFFILTFLNACAHEALVKETSSGYPEGIFRNITVEEVKSKIIGGCSYNGCAVDESSNQIVCSKILSGKDAVIGRLAVGSSYSTAPEQKVKFTIYQQGNDVKVIAYQWVESQSAFGQTRKVPLEDNKHKNSLQEFLFSLGAD